MCVLIAETNRPQPSILQTLAENFINFSFQSTCQGSGLEENDLYMAVEEDIEGQGKKIRRRRKDNRGLHLNQETPYQASRTWMQQHLTYS